MNLRPRTVRWIRWIGVARGAKAKDIAAHLGMKTRAVEKILSGETHKDVWNELLENHDFSAAGVIVEKEGPDYVKWVMEGCPGGSAWWNINYKEGM